MIIRWLGQASFSITTSGGKTIRTDPFDESLGLPISQEPADVVTVSHGHFDHNAVHLVPGEHVVVDQAGTREVGGLLFTGVTTYHDEDQGAKRGENIIFRFELDGVAVCHLGDLGHALQPHHLDEIGNVDLLMVPVGGFYTIDATEADRVIAQLGPRVVVPMHYKLAGMELPISDAEPFLAGKTNVRRADELDITVDTLPAEPEIVVLAPPK
jgi:L-ascorbate metabolism protein UlaG (beta-lactamase superfamily)